MSTPSKPNVLTRLVAPLLSIPLRFKITIPYLVVAILLAGLATWLVSQSFAKTLQDRFRGQLVDSYATASDALFQFESNQLAAERAVARTDGVSQAVISHDTEILETLVRPIAANSRLTSVQVLDVRGQLLYSFQSAPADNEPVPDYASWPAVQRVLSGASDTLGDKYVAVVETAGVAALYTVGPVREGEQLVGAVLVGALLPNVLEIATSSSLANISVFAPDGQLAATTFSGGFQTPNLGADVMAAVAAGGANRLQSRLYTLGSREYSEAVGPLILRGEPSGWLLGVSLPRSLVTENDELSPLELGSWFALGVLAVIGLGVLVAQLIAIPVFDLMRASAEVAQGHFDVKVTGMARDELGVLGRRFNQMAQDLQQREVMREIFGRVVSEEVREAMLDGQIGLGGEVKIVTVLFADIRNFTAFSEQYSPPEVVTLLNSYFAVVTGVIREAGGFVNKFGGDSLLAIFGAPVTVPPAESARKALRAALAISTRLAEFNAGRAQNGDAPIRIGIGINTGEVVTGNIGSEERYEYTVIGDTVNIASRVQGLTTQFRASNVLITDASLKALKELTDLVVVDHGNIALKGKRKRVRVYGVLGVFSMKDHLQSWMGRAPRRQVLEALFLHCRGFSAGSVASAVGVSRSTVSRWLRRAAENFDLAAGELRAEFGLSENELSRLAPTGLLVGDSAVPLH
ncbi:MAG: adenylate/guanylate cyclase domain-containing protein [Chloroflexota bacterium]